MVFSFVFVGCSLFWLIVLVWLAFVLYCLLGLLDLLLLMFYGF